MTWLRLLVLVLACGALSACGDDDYNSDSAVAQDFAVQLDAGGNQDDLATTD